MACSGEQGRQTYGHVRKRYAAILTWLSPIDEEVHYKRQPKLVVSAGKQSAPLDDVETPR